MSFNNDIADVRIRLAAARSTRDEGRACGSEQNHLEGYVLVESLEVDLERLRQQGLRSLAR